MKANCVGFLVFGVPRVDCTCIYTCDVRRIVGESMLCAFIAFLIDVYCGTTEVFMTAVRNPSTFTAQF